MRRHRALVVFAMSFVTQPAFASPTDIDVRVLSNGAKFIGTSMGGVRIILRDADTGVLLASGVTSGSTGDTDRIMTRGRRGALSDPSVAVFRATIDIQEPRLVEVEARGPLAQLQSSARVVSTRWVLPGKHVTAGDGWVLDMPGLSVDVLSPPAHVRLSAATKTVEVRANVALMCGCGIEPKGTWDAEKYEVEAVLRRDGKPAGRLTMAYAGATSQFVGQIPVAGAGNYEIIVTAFGTVDGNAGLDRTTFVVR